MPKVINLRDTKGKVPEGAILVDRRTKWGNPFKVEKHTAKEHSEVVRQFILSLKDKPELVEEAKQVLRGKDLACWCAPLPCHAEVWLTIASIKA